MWGDTYGISGDVCLREMGEIRLLKRIHGDEVRAAVPESVEAEHHRDRAMAAEFWQRVLSSDDMARCPTIARDIVPQYLASCCPRGAGALTEWFFSKPGARGGRGGRARSSLSCRAAWGRERPVQAACFVRPVAGLPLSVPVCSRA